MTTTVPTLPSRPEAAAPEAAATPRWPRFALTALLAATGMLYVWSLSRSGWANAFYSAAAQAGGESWKAWFFGSSDVLGLVAAAALLAVHRQEDAASYTWVAAAVGSNSAAGYQLAVRAPVMAVGGFNGTDPGPTLEQFQALVAAKKIHWFVGGGTGGRGRGAGTDTGGSDDAARIAAWVQANFTATTVDGTAVYDLTTGAGA